MIQAYNFLASWQLFPEKGSYEYGQRPKSGIYKVEATDKRTELVIANNWVNLENLAYSSQYRIEADGDLHSFSSAGWADQTRARFIDSICFEIDFYNTGERILHVTHEILPNGYLKLTRQGIRPDRSPYTDAEIYYKQMSVLPYAAGVASALIKPTEEGIIKHKALTAMEEQTNMQLDQIRRQIELLALQAQEIHQRKELSMLIYNAKLSFTPNIGQVYFLYEKNDGAHMLSLVSPKEWGGPGPFKNFVAAVKLLADHTWSEVLF